MKQRINLTSNEERQEVFVEPHQTLLHVLREELGLIGTKKGCDTGGCGCCTVLLDDRAVYACMVFALSAQGRRITTIEGLRKNGHLDPVQEAFIEAGGGQWGYCARGVVIGAQGV